MDEKINLKAIAQYSDEYATGVLNTFFLGKTRITGNEILQLCEIRQVNLFVINELFKAWKDESRNIRSPYFDYAAEPVKEAVETLMQVLSNHIAVDRQNFTPLLKKAVYTTLLLILDPYDFFADLIEGENDQMTIESFREQLKYIRVNRAPLERLLQKLEEKKVSAVSGNEAFALLDTILEEVNFTPEEVDGYLKNFSIVVPVAIDRFYSPRQQAVVTPPPPPPAPVNRPKEPSREMREPIANMLHQQVSKPTVNEKLAREARPTLADNFKKIARIKDSLTINQKFMFTKVLFHGDFELFSKAIDDLDRQDNMQGAMRYLEQNYEEWDRESEEFHEFMELVEKRFS